MSEIKRFENIPTNIVNKIGVQALADRPNAGTLYGKAGMSPIELKKHFDNMAVLLINKINSLQETFSKEDVAQYVRIALDEYSVENLQDFIDAIFNGTFAERMLSVYPTLTDTDKMPLQKVIYDINKKIVDEIEGVKKTLTDLGYGYTGADVVVVEDGGEVGASVEVIDEDGEKTLVFTFRNYGKAIADEVLVIDEKLEKLEEDTKDAIALPLKKGAGEDSVEQIGCEAREENSVALGKGTIASARGQFVAGRYNKENPNALLIVGNGTSEDNPSNAFEVLMDGTLLGDKVVKIATGTFEPFNFARATGEQMEYYYQTQWNPDIFSATTGDKIELTAKATLVFDFKPKIIFFGSKISGQYVWGDDGFYATEKIFIEAKTAENPDGTYSLEIYRGGVFVGGDASTTPPTILDREFVYDKKKTYPYIYVDKSFVAIGRGGSSGDSSGDSGGDTSLVTFYIDGQEFTVAQGTTWVDWCKDKMDYIYPSGGYIKRFEDDAPLLDPQGNEVREEDIIISGEYGFGNTMVEFEIQDNSGGTTYYTVDAGTTWGEWAETTNGEYRRDEQGPDYAWIMHEGGYVSNDQTWDGVVLDTDIIDRAVYYLV